MYVYIYIIFTSFDYFEEGAILKGGKPPSNGSEVKRS